MAPSGQIPCTGPNVINFLLRRRLFAATDYDLSHKSQSTTLGISDPDRFPSRISLITAVSTCSGVSLEILRSQFSVC